MNKDNYALLVISKSPSELDWILPVLERSKKKFTINTFISSPEIYKKIKKNRFLFNQLKQISKQIIIPRFYDCFFLRLAKLLINKLPQTNEKFSKYLENIISKKIYTENYLKKRLIISKKKLKLIFHEESKNTPWINNFHKREDILTVRYPHALNIFRSKKVGFKNDLKYKNNLLILTPNKNNLSRFKEKYNIKNILVLNSNPRHDDFWKKKIIQNSELKKNKYKFTIGVALKDYYSNNQLKKYKYLLKCILNLQNYVKNARIILKTHPLQSTDEIKKILKEINAKNYILSNKHIIEIFNISDFCISYHRSTTFLDGLALNKPTIKTWSTRISTEKKHIELFGKNACVLTQMKLANIINNKSDLEKYFKLALSNPNSFNWKKQRKIYLSKINTKKNVSDFIIKKIENMLKELKS